MSSSLIYVLTPQPKVLSQIMNWIDNQPKKMEKGGTSDTPQKRQSYISWLTSNNKINELFWAAINKSNLKWNFKLTSLDGYQYTEYNVGDSYDWHQDSFIESQNQGQRKISMTMFLNEDFEGGEFYWEEGSPTLDNRIHNIPVTTGNMIFFPSTTWHKVSPVTKGQRRSLVTWVWGNVW